MKMQQTEVNFTIKRRKRRVMVIHNLHEFNIKIEAAFDNWIARTKDYSSESFAQYIGSKGENIIAISVAKYNQLVRQGELKPYIVI